MSGGAGATLGFGRFVEAAIILSSARSARRNIDEVARFMASSLRTRHVAARVDVGKDEFELGLGVHVRVVVEQRAEEGDGVNEALAILGREEVSHGRVLSKALIRGAGTARDCAARPHSSLSLSSRTVRLVCFLRPPCSVVSHRPEPRPTPAVSRLRSVSNIEVEV